MSESIEPTKTYRLTTWLFNPFYYIAGFAALFVGLSAIAAAGYLGFLGNSHLDGVLDLHTGTAAPLWVFLSEGLINWLSLSLCLLVAGLIVSKSSFRWIDVLGTQAFARFPMIVSIAALLPKANRRVLEALMEMIKNPGGKLSLSPSDAAIFAFAMIIVLVMLVWMVALMYRAYVVACNLKGAKAVISFIIALVIAEIISKVGIYILAKFASLI